MLAYHQVIAVLKKKHRSASFISYEKEKGHMSSMTEMEEAPIIRSLSENNNSWMKPRETGKERLVPNEVR